MEKRNTRVQNKNVIYRWVRILEDPNSVENYTNNDEPFFEQLISQLAYEGKKSQITILLLVTNLFLKPNKGYIYTLLCHHLALTTRDNKMGWTVWL